MISSAVLQWVAAFTMVIDHIGLYLLYQTPAYEPMRIIGRIAFPLYVFMLTEGFRHTRQHDKYFWRIIIFAFISQLPHDLIGWFAHVSWSLNVLFSLATALMAMSMAKKGGWWWLGVIGLVLIAQFGNMEYGAAGILMTVGFYLASQRYKKEDDRPLRVLGYGVVLLLSLTLMLLIDGWLIQMFAILALIPIALYNGQKGNRMPKYFFYVFYPSHLLALLTLGLMLR